ncbi:hypothetical protein [Paenibacillus marinisediminis]
MLTRSRSRKRYSRVRIVVLAALVVMLLLAILSVWYVNYIRTDENSLEAKAVAESQKAVAWASVSGVEKSIWDSVYYVVTGVDEAGVTQMAWVDLTSEQVTVKAASDGVSKKDIEQYLIQQYPGVSIKHIVPGIKDNEYVWQALVRRKDETGELRYYYHFFRFADGTPTGDIYSMPNQ